MKQNLSTLLVTLLLVTIFYNATAQVKPRRCATQEAIEERLRTDPAFKADFEAKQKDLQAYLIAHPLPPSIDAFPTDTIIIPVVVHIVLPDPYRVTDADVQHFIDRLNEDYSGFNADSTTASSFYSVRGHSSIRFTLARRDPSGKATTGIERKVGNIQLATTTAQNLKSVAAGGLAAWPITTYYNLWVGSGFSTTGLLGISPQIGPGAASGTSADGVCVDEQVFSSNPCYTSSSFALARTAVHEIGHNMGLNHTFQSSTSSTGEGCNSTDFSDNLSSAGMSLPAAYLGSIDDTPPLSGQTSGCPADGTANGCTPSVPKMFQNYMDYSDDPCMSLFTKGQVKRMHYLIQTYRPGYLTTQGHLPPVGTPQNEVAAIELISPGGSEYNQANCSTVSYYTPICGSSAIITPKLKILNSGVNKLTTITGNVSVNGVIAATQVYTVDVIGGRTTTLTLPQVTLLAGTNVVKIFTSNPNNVLDSLRTNDTITKTIVLDNTPPAATTLPLFEGFEVGNFNPTATGWKVINGSTASSTTWTRTAAAAKTGTGSAMIKFFGYTPVGDLDYLYSPRLNFNNTSDSVFITFDYAYKRKSAVAASLKDTLSIEVSTDCDANIANWTSLWKKGGTTLATTTALTTTTWTPVSTEWTTTPVKISLMNYRNAPIFLAFKAKNGNGQNLYIDNINIYSVPDPLPVKLTTFTVQQNTKNVVCKWETQLEKNINNFIVERSTNGRTFEGIATVKAIGNTTNNAYYNYTDEAAYQQNSSTLYYRLKIVDVDGKTNYSKIVVVKIGEKTNLEIFPNPATNIVNIQITNSSNNGNKTSIQIVDYLGRILQDKKVITNIGTQNFELNTSNLPKGNYVVVVKDETSLQNIKLIKN